jgi:V8-like Glu-specific endopeptidase
MHPRPSLALFAATILLVIPAFVVTAAAADNGQRDEHARIIAFWTPDRMQSAIPRDFAIEPGRAAVPAGKPGTGGGGTTVGGASWTNTTSLIYRASGKVYFTIGNSAYICSGSVVNDGRPDYSLVLTAGHCAFDESSGHFVTNWLFIPQFDSNPTYTCGNTAYGCWTADALVVHNGYATAGSYNTQATLHDYAIAIVGGGGKAATDNLQLDVTVGSFGISFNAVPDGTQTYAFGYPAAGKYRGADLVYCAGPVGSDPLNGNNTYRLGCDMTGGSSGGPWLTGFDASTGNAGTLTSVNSYTYSSVKNKMHGPKFDLKTQAVFNAADGATSNTIVGG